MIAALSLATIMLLVIAAVLITAIFAPIRVEPVKEIPADKKPKTDVSSPTVLQIHRTDTIEALRPDLEEAKMALRVQADRMSTNGTATAESGITYFEWLTACIGHLRNLWHDCSYNEAKTIIENSLEFWGMNYPSAEYEWTLASARDVAIEISHEGEQFGANE